MKHIWYINYIGNNTPIKTVEYVTKKSFLESKDYVAGSIIMNVLKSNSEFVAAYADYTTTIPIIGKSLFKYGDSIYVNKSGLVF